MAKDDEATVIVGGGGAAEKTVISETNAQLAPVIGTGNRAAVHAAPAVVRASASPLWAVLGGALTGFALFGVTVWLLGAR